MGNFEKTKEWDNTGFSEFSQVVGFGEWVNPSEDRTMKSYPRESNSVAPCHWCEGLRRGVFMVIEASGLPIECPYCDGTGKGTTKSTRQWLTDLDEWGWEEHLLLERHKRKCLARPHRPVEVITTEFKEAAQLQCRALAAPFADTDSETYESDLQLDLPTAVDERVN